MPNNSDAETHRPEWWTANEELKDEMGLPSYEPPRFRDDVYTHIVVTYFSEFHDCMIRFIRLDVTSYDSWEVQVDRTPVMNIDWFRDSDGNTIFEIGSDEFRSQIKQHIESE